MPDWLREFYYFNKSQRIGILALVTIIFIVLLTNFIIIYFYTPKLEFLKDKSIQLKIDSLIRAQKNNKNKFEQLNEAKKFEKVEKEKHLFLFNPNNVSEQELDSLGFKKFQINSIIKYRNAGGSWKIKNDFSKLYGLSSEDFQKLKPYLDLPDSIYYPKKNFIKETKPLLVLNLNKADSAELESLRGIGPGIARSIIFYRKKLGGFYSLNQLKEVYGIKNENFDLISSQLEIKENEVRKIYINNASVWDLQTHPYVGKELAKQIVNARQKHGSFKNLEELIKLNLVNDTLYPKIAPYFSVEYK